MGNPIQSMQIVLRCRLCFLKHRYQNALYTMSKMRARDVVTLWKMNRLVEEIQFYRADIERTERRLGIA